MSRCIEEGDLPAIDLNHRSADVLSDAAGLPGRHIGLADGIQQGSLAVVYMAHNADNRRSGNHIRLILLVLLEKLGDYIHLLLLLAEHVKLHCNLFRLVIVDLLVQSHDLPFKEKLLHDDRGLELHLVGQFPDRQSLRQSDGLDILHLGLFLLGLGHDKCSLSGLWRFLLAVLLPVSLVEPVVLVRCLILLPVVGGLCLDRGIKGRPSAVPAASAAVAVSSGVPIVVPAAASKAALAAESALTAAISVSSEAALTAAVTASSKTALAAAVAISSKALASSVAISSEALAAAVPVSSKALAAAVSAVTVPSETLAAAIPVSSEALAAAVPAVSVSSETLAAAVPAVTVPSEVLAAAVTASSEALAAAVTAVTVPSETLAAAVPAVTVPSEVLAAAVTASSLACVLPAAGRVLARRSILGCRSALNARRAGLLRRAPDILTVFRGLGLYWLLRLICCSLGRLDLLGLNLLRLNLLRLNLLSCRLLGL